MIAALALITPIRMVGTAYGNSSKKYIPPKTCGYWSAGLAKAPPIFIRYHVDSEVSRNKHEPYIPSKGPRKIPRLPVKAKKLKALA